MLKDLIFRDTQPRNGNHIYHWNHNKQGTTIQLEKESGIAYMYGRTDTDYQLNSYNFTINDNGNIGGWNIKYENNKFLGFCIIDNKNFRWNFYLQSTLGKIEDMWYITGKIGEDDKAYSRIYINSIKANIYKIILNSR
ncbi:hypothetical protein [Spiroplasma endosymbiont of Colias croceus]